MVRIFRKGHSWAVVDDTAKKEYVMPTLRLAMDLSYEIIGWPNQFSEGESTPVFIFGDSEVVRKRLAEGCGLFEVGEGYARCEEEWQEPLPPGMAQEAA